MNIQLLAGSATALVLGLNSPFAQEAMTINSFDDLSAHVPTITREGDASIMPAAYPEPMRPEEYVPFFTELTRGQESAAELNSHVLFRGVNIEGNEYVPDGDESLTVIDAQELNCLAENIYFEARGESMAGQLAVGLVTMNRLEDPNYPKTICEVVRQGSLNGSPPARDSCQFSWYCDGLAERITDESAWENAVTLASRVISKRVRDFTDGATNFHSNSVRPRWASNLVRTASVDNHQFYRAR